MFHLILTFNGDFKSYIKWNQKFKYNDLLREEGIIIIAEFNEDVEVMDNYKSEWMCSGQKPEDTDDLKNKLSETIRELLKTHPELEEFTLDDIKVQ